MNAEITTAREFGTDRECQIGRITYTCGVHEYIALAFRYIDPPSDWTLTWIGPQGGDSSQLPHGIYPSTEMLAALRSA